MNVEGIRDQIAAPAAEWLAETVLSALTERLEAALGQDTWALGHRSAAFAFAARLLDEDDVLAFLASHPRSEHHEVAEILRRYLVDRRDVRGFPTN